jgi:hypothetical protein
MTTVDRIFHQRRTDRIMARVDAWAAENAGWDCRDDAAAEVEYCLTDTLCYAMTDDQIVASAISAWQTAE